MISNIDHIAIAVRNLDSAVERFRALTGVGPDDIRIEEVPSENVRVAFIPIGDSKIELLEPLSDESPLSKFLEKRGDGLHHIALETDDLETETRRAESSGIAPLSAPSMGAGNKKIVFSTRKRPTGSLSNLSRSCNPDPCTREAFLLPF